MALSPRLKNFLSELTKEQEKISDYIVSLKSDGLLDDSLNDFLQKQFNDLDHRKKTLIKEFSQIPDFPHTLLPTPPIPLSVNPILIKKKPKQPIFHSEKPNTILFKKSTSPARGSSPSARRYSPQPNNNFEKYEKISQKLPEKNIIIKESPVESTRSTRSSEEKIVNKSFGEISDELWNKYQELREKRNKAHEQMLIIREKMLKDKETELNKILKKASSSPQAQKKTSFKPPTSPKNRKKDENFLITKAQLLSTLPNIKENRVKECLNLLKPEKKI